MCGIAGEFSFTIPVNPHVLRSMTDALIHRGPDDFGIYCKDQIGLGHRRLSIIDLSPSGHQPMWTEDGTLAIVFNGEVYNYQEIRPEIEAHGYRFVGSSDTEVVLNAVHLWGLHAALQRFIGMFAFAIWDVRQRSLFLVRDRLGVKPLYYHKTSEHVIFASELKALHTHPSFRRDLSPKGVGQFFCFGYTLRESTVFRDTYKLPAGHYLRVDADGNENLTRYWGLDQIERGSFRGTFQEASEELSDLCDSAFRYRLVSDVPVGVFLSGGIDSTFLASFLKRRLDADLEHISIGFDDPIYDEVPKAKQVAGDLNLRHIVRKIDAREAEDALFRFVEIWDEPFGDTSGIPTSILCGVARQHVKVALSADGGDELFCGYESYPAYNARWHHVRGVPLTVRKAAAAVLQALPYCSVISGWQSMNTATRRNPQAIARYEKILEMLRAKGAGDVIRVMNEKGWTSESVRSLIGSISRDFLSGTVFDAAQHSDDGSMIDDMMRTDLAAFLGEDILTKVDRASMAASLECRDPFLDHRLVEFAFSLPLDFLYQNGVHKRILKHLIRPWIAPSVLNAPKRGFSIPLYDWMRGPWRPLVEEYLSIDRIRRVGVLNEQSVRNEVQKFYRYSGGRAEKIMLMLNFQMWAERWL